MVAGRDSLLSESLVSTERPAGSRRAGTSVTTVPAGPVVGWPPGSPVRMVFTMSVLTSLQVDSPLSYAIAVVIPALDAIFPVLPSETAVIALGVATAGSADPRIALLVACAAAGAFL